MDSRRHRSDSEDQWARKPAPLFEDLKTYEATTHFNGQSTVMWG